jgi:hypothetical protein
MERGLQARGKNYSMGSGSGGGREWENRQKRDEAVRVLEGGEELIMWVAAARNEVHNTPPLSFYPLPTSNFTYPPSIHSPTSFIGSG